MVKLIVGLGNPGNDYSNTRHNIGFMIVDRIVEKFFSSRFTNKFQAEIADGNIAGEKVFILKPQTYMNNSGIAVMECARFYKIPNNHIIVIHDDLDLKIGRVKVKKNGGNGGHNGLKSVDSHIGTDYWRLRYGISHPGNKYDVSKYVLGHFTQEQKTINQISLDSIINNLPLLIKGDHEKVMNNIAIDLNKIDLEEKNNGI